MDFGVPDCLGVRLFPRPRAGDAWVSGADGAVVVWGRAHAQVVVLDGVKVFWAIAPPGLADGYDGGCKDDHEKNSDNVKHDEKPV